MLWYDQQKENYTIFKYLFSQIENFSTLKPYFESTLISNKPTSRWCLKMSTVNLTQRDLCLYALPLLLFGIIIIKYSFVFQIMFYLKLSGGPGDVATADAEARVVDGAVAPIVWEIWVTRYSNMKSTNGSF